MLQINLVRRVYGKELEISPVNAGFYIGGENHWQQE